MLLGCQNIGIQNCFKMLAKNSNVNIYTFFTATL